MVQPIARQVPPLDSISFNYHSLQQQQHAARSFIFFHHTLSLSLSLKISHWRLFSIMATGNQAAVSSLRRTPPLSCFQPWPPLLSLFTLQFRFCRRRHRVLAPSRRQSPLASPHLRRHREPTPTTTACSTAYPSFAAAATPILVQFNLSC